MKEFIEFLKANKAYSAYIRAFKGMERGDSIENFCNSASRYSYIGGAFNWSNTDKDFMFWCRLNDRWTIKLGETK